MSGAQDQPSNPWAPPAAPGAEPAKPYLPPVGSPPPATPASPATPPATPPGMPAMPAMTPPAAPPPLEFGTPTPRPIDPTVPTLDLGAPGDGGAPKRSKATLVGAVVGVTALVAAGAFAVVKITGNDTRGGAASPTEVGTSLTAALDNEDLLGVVDLLLPGERDTMREPLIDFVDHLRRLEVLSDDASLSKIGGLDIQFTDVTVREEPTNVDDITNIFLSGSSSVSVDGEAVPIGDLLIDEAFDGERPDMDQEPDTAEFEDTQLTVVERDGRWYLSAFYSAAEAARGEFEDQDIPTTGVEPRGGDSPEGALDTFFDAVSDLDLEGAIAALDPSEFEALQRYAPLFLDDAQDAIDEIGIEWGITDTAYEVSGEGSRRNVKITALTFTASIVDAGDIQLVVDGDCATVSVDGQESEKVCTDEIQQGALEELGLGSDVEQFVETVQAALEDWQPSGVAVHEVDGQWFVSPMRTGADFFNGFLAALDADELRDIVTSATDLADGMADELDDALGDLGVLDGESDAFPIDPSDGGVTLPTEVPMEPTETVPGETPSTDPGSATDPEFDAFTECFSNTDPAAGVQCLNDGIAAGTIDPFYVPPHFRFPECGVAEVYWVDVYSMADADFVAMATEASPCFVALVQSGQVNAYEVASELIAPQCLEGKNWYTNLDDGFDTRFFECVGKVRDELG